MSWGLVLGGPLEPKTCDIEQVLLGTYTGERELEKGREEGKGEERGRRGEAERREEAGSPQHKPCAA